ncbi:unnamed protein product, partial [Rotaria magnacalcarata]
MCKFWEEIISRIADKNSIYGINAADDILRDQSTQLKTERAQKLELLYSIDEFNPLRPDVAIWQHCANILRKI